MSSYLRNMGGVDAVFTQYSRLKKSSRMSKQRTQNARSLNSDGVPKVTATLIGGAAVCLFGGAYFGDFGDFRERERGRRGDYFLL